MAIQTQWAARDRGSMAKRIKPGDAANQLIQRKSAKN
ncbi:hypothetical protein BH11PSE8_BH11PSE8_02780 [soil metagenome]